MRVATGRTAPSKGQLQLYYDNACSIVLPTIYGLMGSTLIDAWSMHAMGCGGHVGLEVGWGFSE